MRFISLFSGIEAASLAWCAPPMSWTCVAVAEIEPFPCAVLAHHHPAVPNLGNVEQITEAQIKALGPVDVVVGGFPCQANAEQVNDGSPSQNGGMCVRRLTVTECERLMGLPDGYTQVPYRGKPAADGPRYRAIGNSMAIPVMRWIGQRIDLISKL